MNYSIPSVEFNHILKISKSLLIGDLSFKYTYRPGPTLGLIVSKAYGNSVARNLFKRRCRALFRIWFINRDIDISLIVCPYKKSVSFMEMDAAFEKLYENICT